MKIFINDLSLKIIIDKEEYTIDLMPEIIRDGYIQDENYLFYILNKFLKNRCISESEKTSLIITSSKIMHLYRETPVLKDEELYSMLLYEISDRAPFGDDGFILRYIKEKEDDRYHVNIFLMERKLAESYDALFKKLKVKLVEIHSINDYIFSKEGINAVFNSTTTTVSCRSSDLSRTLFHREIYEFLKDKKMSCNDFQEVLFGTDEFSVNMELSEIKKKSEILHDRRLQKIYHIIRKEKGDIHIKGDLYSERVMDEFKEFFKERKIIEMNLSDIKSAVNFKKKKSKKLPLIPAVFALMLILNAAFSITLNSEIKVKDKEITELSEKLASVEETYIKMNPEQLKREENLINSIERENRKMNDINSKNRKFLETAQNCINLKIDGIDIEKYVYEKENIIISGIAENKNLIYDVGKSIDKELEILSLTDNNGIYNFKASIKCE